MLRELTLGQYYPADSIVHLLDPRTKLFGTMVLLPPFLLLIISGATLSLPLCWPL